MIERREIMSGFSDLKEILITTYKLETSKEFIRLYFSEAANRLIMHDYNDHSRSIVLSLNKAKNNIQYLKFERARRLIQESFEYEKPSQFLNN